MQTVVGEGVDIEKVTPHDPLFSYLFIQGNPKMERYFWREIIGDNLKNVVEKNQPNSRRFIGKKREGIIEQLLNDNDFMQAYRAVHDFRKPETSEVYQHPEGIMRTWSGKLPRKYRKTHDLVIRLSLNGEEDRFKYGAWTPESDLYMKPVCVSNWWKMFGDPLSNTALDIGALLRADIMLKLRSKSESAGYSLENPPSRAGKREIVCNGSIDVAYYRKKPNLQEKV